MADGRPTKLTSEVQHRIVQAIQAGNYMETAAAYAGINKSTLYLWLKRGAREKERLEKNSRARMRKAEAPYVKFSNAVEKALAEAEMRDVMIIGKAASEQWQAAAWRLERKFPQRWGRRVAIEDAKKRDSAKGAITELMQRLREEAGDDDSEADR